MPLITPGTFTLRGFRVGTLGTNWFWGPSPPQYYCTLLGPTLPSVYETQLPTILDTSGHGTNLSNQNPPPGFTPTTDLVFNPALTGVNAPGAAGGSVGTIEYGTLTGPLFGFNGALPDNTSYFFLQTFLRITITAHGSSDAPSEMSDVTQLACSATVTGNYAILMDWWTIPAVDACGEPHTSQLQLAAAPPGDPWVATDDPTPTITVVTPSHGPTAGGTPITISGAGFGMGATVTIDGVAATFVVVVDQFTITCTSPAHGVGEADVVVTNLDGVSST
jgi:hypothetical protein